MNNLEEIHEANINFSFDNHFSLHEPFIEIDESKKIIIKEDKKDKKVKKSNKIGKKIEAKNS